MGVKKIRFPETSGIGIKPVSSEGTERLMRKAIQYAIDNDKPSVTIVHKGNIMKFTEGASVTGPTRWRMKRVRRRTHRRRPVVQVQEPEDRQRTSSRTSIADAFLQQILLRPGRVPVIATLNLNGDYISDALAAQVGGIGIALAPTCGLGGLLRGHARHRAEVRRQGLRQSGSEILSAEMMLRHYGLDRGGRFGDQLDGEGHPVEEGHHDFARLMEGATQVSCSGFGQVMIDHM